MIATVFRFLTFRSTADELRGLNRRHLVFGFLCTWLVGIGRWWEDPRAGLLQHLGIGSVVYVCVLAFFLWLVIWPLTPPYWSFLNVLTFVTFTAPPAFLYAIPVRHGLPLQTAQTVRLWLLAVVAGWRVALMMFYLRRGAGLNGFRWFLAGLFPLLMIVFVITALNLEKVIFDFMGGIQPSDRSVNDAAYGILTLLSALSMLLFLPLLAWYLVASVNSVLARYGPRWRRFFVVLSVVFAAVGITLLFFTPLLFGVVVICSGVVIFMTALYDPDKSSPETPAT